MLPSRESDHIPSILDVLTRSTLLSSVSKTDEVRASVDLYLQPPIDPFGLLEFSALHEIERIGYEYAKGEIRNWKKNYS